MTEHRGLIEVYRSDYRACQRTGLVLQAGGIEYELRASGDAWSILVSSQAAAQARGEIEAYTAENRSVMSPRAAQDDDPTGPPQLRLHSAAAAETDSGWAGVIGYAAILMAAMSLQHSRSFGVEWLSAGLMRAGSVRQGEIWRTMTALTLHGDLAHLLANLAIGGMVGLFAGQLLGSGLAWLSILLAGASGNLLTAFLRPAGHTSIGASTAVFAALGLLSGHAWLVRRPSDESRLVRFAPIIGGAVLLAYLGTSGERTDVLAHIAGFVAGLGYGALLRTFSVRIPMSWRAQWLYGLSAAALLMISWAAAIVAVV